MLTLPPLSLYVHIPWCVRKCPYCDFNSHKAGATLPEQAYVERLQFDLQQSLQWVQERRLTSIFFGGGTPSLFSAASIGNILTLADRMIGFEADCEITLEANPGTFEQQKFSDFYAAGVNRLSIGIQSFNQQHLQTLGRIHNADEAIRAVAMARKAGFDNFNLDLMHGLPEQSQAAACADLQQAIDLGPTHISWYQLTIEPNTEFYSRPPVLPEDDTLADIQEAGHDLLQNHGFQQYEISAYSQPGRQSRHNCNYWSFGDYIGIGAGAHSKLTDLAGDSIFRQRKTRLPQHYLDPERQPTAATDTIPHAERPLEFLMNALRLTQGVDAELFSQRTGLPLAPLQPQLTHLREDGLLESCPDRICTTATGNRFLNTVLERFLSP